MYAGRGGRKRGENGEGGEGEGGEKGGEGEGSGERGERGEGKRGEGKRRQKVSKEIKDGMKKVRSAMRSAGLGGEVVQYNIRL